MSLIITANDDDTEKNYNIKMHLLINDGTRQQLLRQSKKNYAIWNVSGYCGCRCFVYDQFGNWKKTG